MARIPAKILRSHVPGATLADALPHLRETYCGTIAYEIEHIASHRQRIWLREKIESGAFRKPLTNEEKKALLRRLTQVDSLERFMHKAYLGQKQFSVEGLDMTVPMLDEMIQLAAANSAREVVIGMAHRGRLNVLAHNLGRAYETIFREFEGASSIEAVTTIPQGGTGDVKYHHGAQGTYQLRRRRSIIVRLESNPSHLEYVSPVVEGATRAVQTTRQGPHAHIDVNAAMPIILHGDAAFPGQGVVAETFNLQALDGYTVGGTLHLIQNNQVGFTTDPDESRSTRWASDLAKGFDVPIIHVNADDVAACVAAVRLAFAFRQEFGHDVVIDLIGYRRYGHNEADEPAYTQPEMAAKIKKKTPVREIFAAQLVERGVLTQEESDAVAQEIWDDAGRAATASSRSELASERRRAADGRLRARPLALAGGQDRGVGRAAEGAQRGAAARSPTASPCTRSWSSSSSAGATAIGPDGGIDWAQAEALAYASLLTEGTPVRLTGQDVERGTFSQRHLVLHDAKTGQRVSPIQSLPGALAPMELHNSPLSEIACLGFEYGYSMEAPETLVLWEAQFGDFVNSAQVIIDQFIVSALAKWGQTTRLTLLLPHGYEGSGPEHSSARLERFLTLAAEGNIRVANLTTPAQYFHLLRRQARVAKQRPLVIMTPKSLLRLPQATSRIEHLSEARFFPVLAEPRIDEEKVTRLVFCTGKVYYDLKGHATRENNEGVAISRVELLYPFPQEQIMEEVARYPNLREVVWVQEEPRNMGARAHMSPRLLQMPPAPPRVRLRRPARARQPGRGLPGRAHDGAEPHHPHRAGSLDPRVGQPGQAAGRALSPDSHVAALTSVSRHRNRGALRVSQRGETQTKGGSLEVPFFRPLRRGRRADPRDRHPVGRRRLRRGPRRCASASATRARSALNAETQIIASNGSYGTRQSNKRDGDGGGAIYGCRSSAGREPCIRSNNLKGGRAFEFQTVGKRGRRDRGRRHEGSAVHDQRHGQGREPQRRQGRRQSTPRSSPGRADSLFAAVNADGTLAGAKGATARRQVGGPEPTR